MSRAIFASPSPLDSSPSDGRSAIQSDVSALSGNEAAHIDFQQVIKLPSELQNAEEAPILNVRFGPTFVLRFTAFKLTLIGSHLSIAYNMESSGASRCFRPSVHRRLAEVETFHRSSSPNFCRSLAPCLSFNTWFKCSTSSLQSPKIPNLQ